MKNNDRINYLLQFWVRYYQEKNDYDIDYKIFYNKIIYNDINKNDFNFRLNFSNNGSNSMFEKWIKYFSSSSYTNCFFNNYCGWLSFESKEKVNLGSDYIKIYIPLDKNHIENGVKMIFDFLDKNHILHASKVFNRIRCDDVVVRLVNIDDCDKLLNFINNNIYIQEGLIKPNPFAFQKNGIAMVVDGDFSYTFVVSNLLMIYMNDRKKENKLDCVNVHDFYNYIYNLYISQFVNHSSNILKDAFIFSDDKYSDDDYYNFSNNENYYREIISLIINSNNLNFSYFDFLKHYQICLNSHLNDKINNLLFEAIISSREKFNDDAIGHVKAFYDTGNIKYITNKYGLRNRMIESDFRSALNKILLSMNIDFYNYCYYILQENGVDLNKYKQNYHI